MALTATDQGRQVVEDHIAGYRDACRVMLRSLEPAEQSELIRLTEKIADHETVCPGFILRSAKSGAPMAIVINGMEYPLPNDFRVSLLDLLRERLGLTGTKMGCNQGACGACTVIVDGARVLACLTLAVQADGREVRTIEGLASEDGPLHPLQHAFIEHDGLQCGYCTPGQICSALAMVEELRRGDPSYVTADLAEGPKGATRQEIRERMSGNLCRCGAHNGIVEAIEEMLVGEAV